MLHLIVRATEFLTPRNITGLLTTSEETDRKLRVLGAIGLCTILVLAGLLVWTVWHYVE